MASEEEKKKLLLLVPLLLDHNTIYPPLINLNSLILAAISSYEAQNHIKTVQAFEEYTQLVRARTRPILYPRAKQGGQRITEDFLLSLEANTCVYHFRYVVSSALLLVLTTVN